METHSSKESEDGDDSNEESLFLAIEEKNKDKSGRSEGNKNSIRENIVVHAKLEPIEWIIVSGCSNHMNSDKEKFINLNNYDGGSVKFAREEVEPILWDRQYYN